MTQDKHAPPAAFVRRHKLGPDRSLPTDELASMRARCAALEVEAADSTARMHDERERADAALAELEVCREALIMISAAVRCSSDRPYDVVEAVRVDEAELDALRSYRERVEAAGRASRGLS